MELRNSSHPNRLLHDQSTIKGAFSVWAVTCRRTWRHDRWKIFIPKALQGGYLIHHWRPPTTRKAKPYINYIKPQTKVQTHHNILSPYQHFLSNTSNFVIRSSLAGTTLVTFLKTNPLLVLCKDINLTLHTLSGQTYQLTNLASSMGITIFWFGVF